MSPLSSLTTDTEPDITLQNNLLLSLLWLFTTSDYNDTITVVTGKGLLVLDTISFSSL